MSGQPAAAKSRHERLLVVLILTGMVAGVITGLLAHSGEGALGSFARSVAANTAVFGKLFLSALRMIVAPLVLFSVVSGIAGLAAEGNLGRRFAKVFAYFIATTMIAVLIGLVYTNVIGPGRGIDSTELISRLPSAQYADATKMQEGIAARAPKTVAEFVSTQIDSLFMNPFAALANLNLVGVVVFSIMLGLALASSGSAAAPAIAVFKALDDAMMRIVQVVIWLAPAGVFGLAAQMVGSLGLDVIKPLGWYFATVSLGLLTHLFVVFSILLVVLARYSPLKFFARAFDVMLFAFSTSSSAATMPLTLRDTVGKMGVDQGSANFVIPMGATVNMNGTAMYEGVAALFIAQLIGLELSLAGQVAILITSTLAAIGTAAIPQAGLITMVIVFNAVGIPLEWMAVIIIVDRPLDHMRTVVNVVGDQVGAIYLSASQGLLKRDT